MGVNLPNGSDAVGGTPVVFVSGNGLREARIAVFVVGHFCQKLSSRARFGNGRGRTCRRRILSTSALFQAKTNYGNCYKTNRLTIARGLLLSVKMALNATVGGPNTVAS